MSSDFLFVGCSLTQGAELEGLDNDLEYRRTHRFSHLVANHFKASYENISSSGKSNDWIVEKTISWIEEGNNCNVAVIQFTIKSRTILYYNGKKEILVCDTHAKQIKKKNLTSIDPQRYKIINDYYEYFYTEYLGEQNFYKNLFLLKTYLTYKKINYVFLVNRPVDNNNLGWNLPCEDLNLKVVYDFYEGILPLKKQDEKYYCKNIASTLKYLDSHTRYLTGGHPNELGHQKIADYIIEQVQHFLTKGL